MIRLRYRKGVTLLELVLFIAILGMVMVFLIPFMVFSGENQRKQQALASIQEAGASVLQGVGRRLRDAERIQYPPLQETGSVLALQTAFTETDPTVIAVSGSSLIAIERTSIFALTPPDVIVRNFVITNTSVSATRQSLHLQFEMEREYPLVQSGSFVRNFESTFTLFPSDVTVGNSCGCVQNDFRCNPQNVFRWGVCSGTCNANQRALVCAPN